MLPRILEPEVMDTPEEANGYDAMDHSGPNDAFVSRLVELGARFDKGQFRGRKALFCVTTGSSADESAHNGKEGDIRMLLWPMAYTLRYLGFSVVEPKIVHGVHGYHRDARKTALDARLREFLDSHATLIAAFDTLPLMPFNADTDFDADGRLKSDAPSNSRFIRHEP